MPHVVLDRLDAAAAPSTTIGAPVPSNGMTLANLDDELNAMLIGRTDVGSARRRLMANLAYTDMVTSLKLPELKASLEFDITADQQLYRLPSCVYSILSASMIDSDEDPDYGGRPLAKSDEEAYRARQLLTGRPSEFFRFTDMIVLWPTPEVSGTMVIDFRIRPTWLTLDSHCPIVYVEWQEGILLRARQKAFQYLQEWDAAQIAGNEYVQFIRLRQDTSAVEEDNKVLRSSVPRDDHQLGHPRGYPQRYRTRNG